jgi:HAD superfamily hydrolase (TIGR01509 family)
VSSVRAVVFDLDGVLMDSEQVWDAARRDLVVEAGGRWHARATADMMGMSSPEWSRYLRRELGVPLPVEEINAAVVERVKRAYRRHLPLLPGAVAAVRRLAEGWPLGLATSSNREIVELVLEQAGVAPLFAAAVSSEEVARGKPAPDVYLEAAARLGAEPQQAAAIEDSANGLRAARAAGMRVIAIPNPHFPPPADALALADVTLRSLDELSAEVVAG